ncbi:DNA phosphorothioation-dependent restriction protein DptG [Dehalogenimonas formicexedens]|uniref:DNA phosphorothioation-dependent restriction protein DptG n=2 Tax=Dehalogenimonas TaxID=670486 RepID=A0A1P8F5U1_9CHLR|nr:MULTISPECIES: ATP-binding protein [Dehalogenimonas]APV43843.1 DNA phosphorothioation-dependent restriction protein DptG [Dehalogenimonas formicexedens]KTB49312.1 hypothetical protein DEALK_02250 [Dehalogenimonas alkenigignens]
MAYNITRTKLREYTDSTEFEHLCCALLVADYKRIIPLGGSGDQGRDAVMPQAFPSIYQSTETGTIFQFSLQKSWRKKLDSELKKVFENGFKPLAFVFVTNQEISTGAKTKCQEDIAATFGVKPEILDLSWLQARLENPEYLHVRRQYLSLDDSTLPAFITLADYAARRIDRLRAPDLPVFLGRDVENSRFKEFTESKKRVLVLSAPPGVGKTKFMLEGAKSIQFEGDVKFLRQEVDSIEKHLNELDPSRPLLLFIDDAQELKDLRQLLALILSPELGEKLHVVMATHPCVKGRIVGEFDSRAIEYSEIELTPLPNPAIDQLIQLPQMGIKDEGQRGAIIKIAEGNPLVACVAASLLRETGTLAGLTRDQVIMAHFMRSLQSSLPAKSTDDKARLILAIISATKGIEYGNFRELLAGIVCVTAEALDVLIDQLVAGGLLMRGWRGLRVTPELLAETLVLDSFFAANHSFDFREKVLAPFFAQKGSKIFRSLAEAEMSGSSDATNIIDGFMADAREFVKTANNASRQAILDWLKGFAFFRPEDALLVLRAMLEAPVPDPAVIKSPLWGTMTITHVDVWRSACSILADTGWHCEACLRETMTLLYLIGAQQDHSRSNSFPLEDAIRVLNEQVIPFEPGKPLRIQEIAQQEIESWLSGATSEKQLEVIISALLTLLSLAWTSTNASPTDSRSFTVRNGFIKLTDPIQKIREGALNCVVATYERCGPAQRISLIQGLSDHLMPRVPSGIPDELRSSIADDLFNIISALKCRSQADSAAEKYALWKALEFTGRLKDERLEKLQRELFSDEVDEYAHLVEWPGHIRGDDNDWKTAGARHGAYWEARARAITVENLDAELVRYDRHIREAGLCGDQVSSAIQTNIGILARSVAIESRDILLALIKEISGKYPNLQRFAGAFLGELLAVDQANAKMIMKEWIKCGNIALRAEACRAMLWIQPGQFTAAEIELLTYLTSLNDPTVDRLVVGWFGSILKKVDDCDPKAAVEIVRLVSTRKDKYALNMIAESLRPGGSISQITAKDLLDIALSYVEHDSHELDFDIEHVLMRLFLLNPDAWLAFWEARIKRQLTRKEGDSYLAVPFHLSAEADYVVSSPHKLRVLGTLLEWSSRNDFAYQHTGTTLLKLYSDKNPNVVQDILEEWIASGEQGKLHAVARALREMGYSDFFLMMANKLLNVTDDKAIEACLVSTVASFEVVCGSFVPLYEKRKADFAAWLANPQASLQAKAFARKQISYLSRQIELHAKEDAWDD